MSGVSWSRTAAAAKCKTSETPRRIRAEAIREMLGSGMTMAAVGEELGISRARVNDITKGRRS